MINIYKITDKLNGKSYIGQSAYFCDKDYCNEERFLIDDIIQSKGVENFIFEILKKVDNKEYLIWKDYYIMKYNTKSPNGYNEDWNCSEDLREILFNTKNVVPAATMDSSLWEDQILTEEELKDIEYYRSNFGYKFIDDENFIGTIDKYKRYKYLIEQNRRNRKHLNIEFPKIYKKDKVFSEGEFLKYDYFKKIISNYNRGVCIFSMTYDYIDDYMEKKCGVYTEWKRDDGFNYKYEEDKITIKTDDTKTNKFVDMFRKLLKRDNFDSSTIHFFNEDKELTYEEAEALKCRGITIEIRCN